SGAAVKRGEVLRAFADRFWGWYRGLESGGGEFFREAFMPEYASRSVTLGREVSVAEEAQTYTARAEAIGESGELIVRADDGAVRSVWAADVSVR
ncbi:MAG: hypothetical protein LBH66_00285, partial [Oscillospiraceae bacterium]|nr:hypothetical protein [Oscillospiraceae bacterium]